MANDTEVSPQNKDAFEALMGALAAAKDDNTPTIFSKFNVEEGSTDSSFDFILSILVTLLTFHSDIF